MSETTVNVKAWSLIGDDFIISEQDGIKYFTMTQEKANRIASRMADLESQLAEAQRREGLLRAVAEAAWQILGEASQDDVEGSAYCVIHSDYLLSVHGFLQAAIDGGALEKVTK